MLAGLVVVVALVAVGIGFYISLKQLSLRTISKNQIQNKLPGPWEFPIVGHLPFFGKHPGMTFMKWAKIYGHIFFVKFGGVPAVVLNDGKIIKEALNLDTFSGRPYLRNLGKPGEVRGLAFTDGPRQIEQRKFALKTFKGEGFSQSEFELRTVHEVKNFLIRLRHEFKNSFDNKKSEKLLIHQFFQFPIMNSIWVPVIGQRLNEGDPKLEKLIKAVAQFTDTGSSVLAQVSWFFPWVSNILSCLGLNCVVNSSNLINSFTAEQIEESRGNYVAGHPKNFTHAYFDQVSQTTNQGSSFFNGREQSFTAADIFKAALDTTSVTMDWLLFYMVREPHVQKKLQEEIDNIIGVDGNGKPQIPSISDRIKMPYAEAVLKEVLRISSVAPLSFFHRTTEEVYLRGYRIPKNTMIVPNLYAVHHDPELWSEPDEFQPERFLRDEAEISVNNPKSAGLVMAFGTGKRMCIGEVFARDQLFLMTTHFFQKFTVSRTDKIPPLDPVFGMVVSPAPFELLISERNVFNCLT